MDARFQTRIQRYGWDKAFWFERVRLAGPAVGGGDGFRSREGYRIPGEFVVVRGIRPG